MLTGRDLVTLSRSPAAAATLLRSGAATMEGIRQCLARAKGLRGIERAREAMLHVEPRSQSPMESRLRLQLALPGLPAFEAQRDAYDEDGLHLGRVDLRARSTVIEDDGREERLRRARFATDRHRQGALLEVGLELRRCSPERRHRAGSTPDGGDRSRALVIADARPAPRVVPGPDTLPGPLLSPLPTRVEVAARVGRAS